MQQSNPSRCYFCKDYFETLKEIDQEPVTLHLRKPPHKEVNVCAWCASQNTSSDYTFISRRDFVHTRDKQVLLKRFGIIKAGEPRFLTSEEWDYVESFNWFYERSDKKELGKYASDYFADCIGVTYDTFDENLSDDEYRERYFFTSYAYFTRPDTARNRLIRIVRGRIFYRYSPAFLEINYWADKPATVEIRNLRFNMPKDEIERVWEARNIFSNYIRKGRKRYFPTPGIFSEAVISNWIQLFEPYDGKPKLTDLLTCLNIGKRTYRYYLHRYDLSPKKLKDIAKEQWLSEDF